MSRKCSAWAEEASDQQSTPSALHTYFLLGPGSPGFLIAVESPSTERLLHANEYRNLLPHPNHRKVKPLPMAQGKMMTPRVSYQWGREDMLLRAAGMSAGPDGAPPGGKLGRRYRQDQPMPKGSPSRAAPNGSPRKHYCKSLEGEFLGVEMNGCLEN